MEEKGVVRAFKTNTINKTKYDGGGASEFNNTTNKKRGGHAAPATDTARSNLTLPTDRPE